MSESFKLNVITSHGPQEFDAELHVYGYTHKISVQINGSDILFEPDEERNYRAVLPEQTTNGKNWDLKLVEAIANTLQETFS